MVKNTDQARKKSLQNRKKKHDERLQKLYRYIRDHTKSDLSKLSKVLRIPIGSVVNLIEELLSNNLITEQYLIKNGRSQRYFYPLSSEDGIYENVEHVTILTHIKKNQI